jgi:hypothetical protein
LRYVARRLKHRRKTANRAKRERLKSSGKYYLSSKVIPIQFPLSTPVPMRGYCV